MIAHSIFFYFFSIIAIFSALMVITSRSTINSVFFFNEHVGSEGEFAPEKVSVNWVECLNLIEFFFQICLIEWKIIEFFSEFASLSVNWLSFFLNLPHWGTTHRVYWVFFIPASVKQTRNGPSVKKNEIRNGPSVK